MAHVKVRKTGGGDVEGMIKAGEVIGELLEKIAGNPTQSEAKDFFDELWTKLDGKEGAPPRSPSHEFFLRVPDANKNLKDLWLFRTATGQDDYNYATYQLDGNGNLVKEANFLPRPKLDKTKGSAGNAARQMTIALPEMARDATGDAGYLKEIVDNLRDILEEFDPDGDGDNDQDDEDLRLSNARKYLLAVIFLNRCQ